MGREFLSLGGPHNVPLPAAVLSQHGHVMLRGGQVVTCSVVVENYLVELCLVLLDVLQSQQQHPPLGACVCHQVCVQTDMANIK